GPHEDAWAAALDLPDNVVLLGPGSGAYSQARRWAPERFVQVAQALAREHSLQPLVLGGLRADEQRLAHGIAAQIGTTVIPPAPSPQALGALIRRSMLLVANDSGPVHVATTVGTPVVAIFGPSNDLAGG